MSPITRIVQENVLFGIKESNKEILKSSFFYLNQIISRTEDNPILLKSEVFPILRMIYQHLHNSNAFNHTIRNPNIYYSIASGKSHNFAPKTKSLKDKSHKNLKNNKLLVALTVDLLINTITDSTNLQFWFLFEPLECQDFCDLIIQEIVQKKMKKTKKIAIFIKIIQLLIKTLGSYRSGPPITTSNFTIEVSKDDSLSLKQINANIVTGCIQKTMISHSQEIISACLFGSISYSESVIFQDILYGSLNDFIGK